MHERQVKLRRAQSQQCQRRRRRKVELLRLVSCGRRPTESCNFLRFVQDGQIMYKRHVRTCRCMTARNLLAVNMELPRRGPGANDQ